MLKLKGKFIILPSLFTISYAQEWFFIKSLPFDKKTFFNIILNSIRKLPFPSTFVLSELKILWVKNP